MIFSIVFLMFNFFILVNNGDLFYIVKIGIGVGVGFGFLLLIILFVFLIRFVLKWWGRDSKVDFVSGLNEEMVYDVGKLLFYLSFFVVYSVNGYSNVVELVI